MRWIIRALLTLIALGVLGMTALFAIPTDEITDRAMERLSDAVGRDVVIRGTVRPRLFPAPGIRAEEIEIANPEWVEEGPLLVAQSLDVSVSFFSLMSRELRFRRVEVSGPRLVLVRAAAGDDASWREGLQSSDSGQADGPVGSTAQRIGFDRIILSDAAVLIVDRAMGQVREFGPINAQLRGDDAADSAALDLTLVYQSLEYALSMNIGSLSDFRAGGISEITAALSWPGGEANFEGRAGFAPALEGQVSIATSDLAPVLALAGLDAPTLPQGLGRETLSIDGGLTLADGGSVHLRGVEFVADGNQLVADLDLMPGADRPELRGNITTGVFAIAETEPATAGGGNTQAGPQGTAQGWSTNPIDAAALLSLDTEISISAGRLSAGDIGAEEIRARIVTDAGRMVIDLGQATVFQGVISGQLVANARGTFSARADLEATDIALNPMVRAFTGYERLEGFGSGRISIVAQGASTADLMAEMEGSGAVELGPGAIIGLDIAGMLRDLNLNYRGDGARTVYDGLTASFSVSDGVLANRDLVMQAPWGGVRGDGEVDLGRRTLDYLLTPGLSARGDGSSRLNLPIRISGPWANPEFAPDLEALAEREMAGQVDALETIANEAARDLVEEELGLTIEDGVSREDAASQIGDAIEDRLEQGLRDGIRGLLE